jgi:2-keto-4-pentenoate hydratase
MTDLATELAAARRAARTLDPAAWRTSVASVADAYAVQDKLAAGQSVRAWKVSALTPEQQRGYPTDRPVAGALFAPFCDATPGRLARASLVAPLLECEIAFRLGRDLPQRDRPYSEAEVADAVDAVVPAIEIADCRWGPDAGDLMKLADDMGNGAFIAGAPVTNWRPLDLTAIGIVLTFNGKEAVRGDSDRILGNPFRAMVALANVQPLPAGGLKRGQIVTTGTCTNPLPLEAGEYVAEFAGLGSVRLTVV